MFQISSPPYILCIHTYHLGLVPMASTAAASSPATYTTPTKRAAFANAEAGPSRARPAGASPAYVCSSSSRGFGSSRVGQADQLRAPEGTHYTA